MHVCISKFSIIYIFMVIFLVVYHVLSVCLSVCFCLFLKVSSLYLFFFFSQDFDELLCFTTKHDRLRGKTNGVRVRSRPTIEGREDCDGGRKGEEGARREREDDEDT